MLFKAKKLWGGVKYSIFFAKNVCFYEIVCLILYICMEYFLQTETHLNYK